MNQQTNKPSKLTKIHYKVSAEWNNYRLDKLIMQLQPHFSKVFIYKLIRSKKLLVNNKRTTNNYHVQTDDVVSFYGLADIKANPSLAALNLNKLPPLNVLYEDKDVIVVHKPARVPVQANAKKLYDNMNNRLLNHLKWQPNDNQKIKFKPCFAHRLDTNTEGVLIGAKTYQAFNALYEAFKKHQVFKIYDALVWNSFLSDRLEIKNYLLKDKKTNKVQVYDNPVDQAKFAHSIVYLVSANDKFSHVQVELLTGRTHQIRAHLKYIKHPICGDQKYGNNLAENKKWPFQALVASQIEFNPQVCVGLLKGLKNKVFKLKDLWFLKNI